MGANSEDSTKQDLSLDKALIKILNKENQYQIPDSDFFPDNVEVLYSNEESIDNITLAKEEIKQWGFFFNFLYRTRTLNCYGQHAILLGPAPGMISQTINVNAESYRDMRKNIIPEFDQQLKNSLDYECLLRSLISIDFIESKQNKNEFYEKLILASKHFDDHYQRKLSRAQEKAGGKQVKLQECYFYELIIDKLSLEYNKMNNLNLNDVLGNGKNKNDSPEERKVREHIKLEYLRSEKAGNSDKEQSDKEPSDEIENNSENYLTLPREVIFAISHIFNEGKKYISNWQSDKIIQEISDHLDSLKQEISPTILTAEFNNNWKKNYENNIDVCIFKSKKRSSVSLLYALDPDTNLLFFNINKSKIENKIPAQAALIFFNAEDSIGKQYVVLEGVLMNEEFERIEPFDRNIFTEFNSTLPDRKRHLDILVHYAAAFAREQNKDLFINLNELISSSEYGPHEFGFYLTKLFPELQYGVELMPNPFAQGKNNKSKLIKSVLPIKKLYLRKNNSKLANIIKQNLNQEMQSQFFDDKNRFLLFNHSYADMSDLSTLVNKCVAKCYGFVINTKRN